MAEQSIWRANDGKKGPFQEIEIQQPEMIGEFAIVKKYAAIVTDAKDQAVYNAIVDAAKKAGINSLLLMDRRFVLNALEVAIKRKEMLDSCSAAPTIEAEPVRHGKWEKICTSYWLWKPDGAHAVNRFKYKHNDCGKVVAKAEHYCPNCGAKMNLEG